MSAEPETPYVRRTDADGVATLLLDRPAKLNALSTPMLEALDEAYATASKGMVSNLDLEDAAEGIDAFLARRPAAWRGR